MNLSRMQDIAGCRIVVGDIRDQDRVVKLLLAALVGARVVDRRKKTSHGYRAVHIIATAQGKTVEIQVRTSLQDLWAQLSEKLADNIDPRIKYGGGDPDLQHTLSLHLEYVADLESGEAEGGEAEPQRQGAGSKLDEQKAELQQSLLKLIATIDATRKKVN
jgi:putative GTP pyrophosphokinase